MSISATILLRSSTSDTYAACVATEPAVSVANSICDDKRLENMLRLGLELSAWLRYLLGDGDFSFLCWAIDCSTASRNLVSILRRCAMDLFTAFLNLDIGRPGLNKANFSH